MSQDLIATLENLFPTLFILAHSRFMDKKLCILCHTDETHPMTLTLMDIVLTIIDSFSLYFTVLNFSSFVNVF
jgi:hypothetical protein